MTAKRERERDNTAYTVRNQQPAKNKEYCRSSRQPRPFVNLRLNDTDTFLTNLNKCVVTFFPNLIGIADHTSIYVYCIVYE